MSTLIISDIQFLRIDDPIKTVALLIQHKILRQTDMPKWKQQLLEMHLRNGAIILFIDGLDEILSFKDHYRQLLTALFSYSQIVLACRPYVNIPFIQTLELHITYFDLKQIETYLRLNTTLKSDDIPVFIEKIRNPRILELLKIPLHLKLFCDIYLKNPDDWRKIDWEAFNKINLYRELIILKLQNYLTRNHENKNEPTLNSERIYRRCKQEIKTIAQFAYADSGLPLIKDDNTQVNGVLEEDVLLTGLVTKIKSGQNTNWFYSHQTFKEYFQAIYLAIGLCSNTPEKSARFATVVRNFRYDPRFAVVWSFTLGLLIYIDPLLPNTDKGLKLFLQSIFAPPIDLLVIRHWRLVTKCFIDNNVLNLPIIIKFNTICTKAFSRN